MVFHVLNRGVGRRLLFTKDEDFLAFRVPARYLTAGANSGKSGRARREEALRLIAIRQARLEPLALSASGHERMVNGWAAASGEKRIDFVCRNRLFR